MARMPTFEEILLEIHQSLGLERPQSKDIRRFSDLEMPLDQHLEKLEQRIGAISTALDMDESAKRDLRANILEWDSAHKGLELHLWTSKATQQQVLWHLLAYSYVPGLARRVAFWSLHGVWQGQGFDAGMPGGTFWFLPNWDPENKKVTLPVPQVMDWLRDLLGEQSKESAFGDAVRKVDSWRLEGKLPKSAREIDDTFSDQKKLPFCGTFKPRAELSSEAAFQEALAFVQRKGLENAEALCDQIPMSAERLRAVLKQNATEEEKREFTRQIATRYAEPTMQTIRQRLKVARMVQDGYRRLLNFLCPGVDQCCGDPEKNKLIQIDNLFRYVYNLSVAAVQHGTSAAEHDAWFEAQLPWWDRADLFFFITPSHQKSEYPYLAERLTRKFMLLDEASPLEDWWPVREEDNVPIIKRRILRLQEERQEGQRLKALIERIRTASPWRALQKESSYFLVSQLAQQNDLPAKIREMALQRLRELAIAPEEKVEVIMIELESLLDCEPKLRPKDVFNRVQSLLDEAEVSPGFAAWKAPLLRFRAKHHLFQNHFEDAVKDYRAALDACSERNFGPLRTGVVQEGWASEIAKSGLEKGAQEKYYRNMLAYGMFPEGIPGFGDAAVQREEFFWATLYHPYPGIVREEAPAVLAYKTLFEKTLPLIKEADWAGLRQWMREHAKKFRKTSLQEARRNSVLLAWLKLLHKAKADLCARLKTMLLPDLTVQNHFECFLENWREAMRILLEAWPEQAKIADFKGQTPLMLVADDGDAGMTQLLAPKSDVDAQDDLGRTALHAAVSGGSPECIALILDLNPLVADKVTYSEKNTVLHTAVRFGMPENVRLILEAFPGLARKTNDAGETPLKMASDILEDLPSWQEFMQSRNRRIGTKADFEKVIALLAQA